MSMRRACVVAACTLLAACGGGGGGGSGSNAAVGRSFTYGSAQTFSTSATGTQLTAISSLGQGATSANVQGLANQDLVSVILGQGALGAAPGGQVALQRALAAAHPALATSTFDPSCVTTTATSVTFTRCTETDVSGTLTLDGHFTVTDQKQLTWTFTVGLTSTSTSSTLRLSATQTGDLTATPTALVGSELTTLTIDAAGNGQTAHASVDESLALDVTLDPACQTGAVAGTAEAKRVWTARPSGATATDLPDAAAKVTWTGCGTATVQYGH